MVSPELEQERAVEISADVILHAAVTRIRFGDGGDPHDVAGARGAPSGS